MVDHTRTIPPEGFVLTDVGPNQTFAREITDGVAATDSLGWVVTSEDFPASSLLHTPGDGMSLREAILAAPSKIVELADGNFGADASCRNTSGLAGAYVFNRNPADLAAIFDGNYQVGAHFGSTDGVTLRNYHVRRFLPEGGGTRYDGVKAGAGEINWESATNCLAKDMTVGLSRMNAYKMNGHHNVIDGGRAYDCHRFAVNGGGHHNTIRNWLLERISWKTSSEVGVPSEQGNRGVTKVALCGPGWLWEDITIRSAFNGVWFDIGNEPATIRRIDADDVFYRVVFLEVSYGVGVEGKRWLVEDVVATNSSMQQKGVEPTGRPSPAIVQVSLTPDVDIRRVQGDGQQFSTVGLITWNHDQLNNLNRSRMGIVNCSITECVLEGHGFAAGIEDSVSGSFATGLPRNPRPDFQNNTYDQGADYRYKHGGADQTLTYQGWINKGFS